MFYLCAFVFWFSSSRDSSFLDQYDVNDSNANSTANSKQAYVNLTDNGTAPATDAAGTGIDSASDSGAARDAFSGDVDASGVAGDSGSSYDLVGSDNVEYEQRAALSRAIHKATADIQH